MARSGQFWARWGITIASATTLISLGCQTSPPATRPTPPPANPEVQPLDETVNVNGLVVAPADLAAGDPIVAATDTGSLYRTLACPVGAASPSPLPVSSAYKVVENALVTIKDSELRVIPEIPSRYTQKTGIFNFGYFLDYVPEHAPFFFEARMALGTKTYLEFGLAETCGRGELTDFRIDVASTLVARLFLQIWQRSGDLISFTMLTPLDYDPLLDDLRERLKNGPPSGMSIDLSKVNYPVGAWTAAADKQDSALHLLNQLVASDRYLWADEQTIFDKLKVTRPTTDPTEPPVNGGGTTEQTATSTSTASDSGSTGSGSSSDTASGTASDTASGTASGTQH